MNIQLIVQIDFSKEHPWCRYYYPYPLTFTSLCRNYL